MQKSTKGALAAVAAAVLLLGGGGSLAYWSSTQDVVGGDINSGHLALNTDATNAGCGAWTLDSGENPPGTYAVGDPLVPGDVLTKSCAYTIDASGNHLRATIGATAPDISGALASALTIDAAGLEVNGTPATEFTDANNGESLSFSVTVTFNAASDNTTQDLAAVLNDITITATQVHS